MIRTRRQLLYALALLPATRAATAEPCPVDTAAVVGCLNAWRLDMQPLAWESALVAPCRAWAVHLSRVGFWLPSGKPRHDPTANECISMGQATWAEAISAWLASPPHLAVIRLPQFARVGMAGYQRPSDGWRFWVLRLLEVA